ncbi:MAG: proteasome ATPase [Lawsonella sp.]
MSKPVERRFRPSGVETIDDLKTKVHSLESRNIKLANLLKASREQLNQLKDELDSLAAPPTVFGTVLDLRERENAQLDKKTARSIDVFTNSRPMRLLLAPNIELEDLAIGATVRLNDALVVVEVLPTPARGNIFKVQEMIDDAHALVSNHTTEERVVLLAQHLQNGIDTGQGTRKVRIGDSLIVDDKMNLAINYIERGEVEQLILEEVPDVSYEDIGGLAPQIQQIKDSVELPFLHRDLYAEYDLRPPKGVLLYGPPGCGKTLIAKAVANSLAHQIAEKNATNEEDAKKVEGISFFLNVKGPELLNKYVGETERQIRLIFQQARDKANEGMPMIIFFDEMDAVFRTRGSGISSDMENTVVPQLLSELDGVESLENVIVIGATNREDMIDPAILRPGRLDVKISIQRPDRDGARDILSKYLNSAVPLSAATVEELGAGDVDKAYEELIQRTVERMYAEIPENKFIEVTYRDQSTEILYFKDFVSGAMLHNIVDRAKKSAIKAKLEGHAPGITEKFMMEAVELEYAQNEDLPNANRPDEWARVAGKRGERIIDIRLLSQSSNRD